MTIVSLCRLSGKAKKLYVVKASENMSSAAVAPGNHESEDSLCAAPEPTSENRSSEARMPAAMPAARSSLAELQARRAISTAVFCSRAFSCFCVLQSLLKAESTLGGGGHSV